MKVVDDADVCTVMYNKQGGILHTEQDLGINTAGNIALSSCYKHFSNIHI